MTPIIPKLGLSHIPDSAIGEYTQDKIGKINAAPAFAAVNPSTAEVQTKKDDYEDAVVKADDGAKADTALKNQIRNELEELLTAQAFDCAKIANGNLPLYLTTGYEARDTKGSPTGPLGQVADRKLAFGDNEGELKASWNKLTDADNYSYQVYSDAANPGSTIIKQDISKQSKTVISGLTPGQKVWMRVRGNGGSIGHGPWSDPAEKRVP